MNPAYVLDPAAESDMREVVRYTYRQWGATQAASYKAKLKRCMKAFSEGSSPYKDLGEISPGLRMGLCEHHYIFVQLRPNAPAVVLAILHERMDIIQHLKTRLST